MSTLMKNFEKYRLTWNSMRFLLLLAACLVLGSSGILAQVRDGAAKEVRAVYPSEFGVMYPVGLTYLADANQFFVLDNDHPEGSTVVTITPYEDLVSTTTLNFVAVDTINTAFDNSRKRLFMLSSEAELVQIETDEDSLLSSAKQNRSNMSRLALQKPQGMAVDLAGEHLFILDSGALEVVKVALEPEFNTDRASISKIDLSGLGVSDLQGIALHPVSQNLYLLSPTQQKLYELTQSGRLLTSYDLAALELASPRGFTFAPSADLTDAPESYHLFIADRGSPDGKLYGKIVEAALTTDEEALKTLSVPVISTFLVQTVDMSTFNPASPDPTGIGYIPSINRFIVSDSEVNEIPALFTGDNLFEISLPNTLARSGSTTAYSNEPTGVGFNPSNDHIFISDDNAKDIFEVDPSTDGLHGTSDDVVTSFSTTAFNSQDPEGVTFDTVSGHLFITDGLNNEVYRVDSGVNGIFDGPPAAGGDDVVTSFDTLALGIEDPEGIHHDSVSGNLILTSKNDNDLYEVTTSGTLVQLLDVSDADGDNLAGVTMAPGSVNANDTNFYIVERGVDNNSDPNENDGKLYEMTKVFPAGDILISSSSSGIAGGTSFSDEDILSYDSNTGTWARYFDGSDVGVMTDLNSFMVLDDGSFLMSFELETSIGTLGLVDDSDIVRFIPTSLGSNTSGTFEWYFDGSDVELTANGEDIDGFILLSDGTIVMSTLGVFSVTGVSGHDEDMLAFEPTLLGESTSGTWSLYFDGSDVGLDTNSSEDIQGLSIDSTTGNIYITTKGPFSVTGASGDAADILLCVPGTIGENTTCTFSLFWDGSANSFGGEIGDGIFVDTEAVSSEVQHNAKHILSLPLILSTPYTPQEGK